MGNRAYIVLKEQTKDGPVYSPALYLHWNGGPESVYAFLDYAEKQGCRMSGDPAYGMARLCQICGNFFGGTLSLGLQSVDGDLSCFTPGDNGLFVVSYPDGKRQVERMISHYVKKRDGEYEAKTQWLTPDQVEAERKAAYAHEYHTGKEPIANKIAKANDAFFVGSDHKD